MTDLFDISADEGAEETRRRYAREFGSELTAPEPSAALEFGRSVGRVLTEDDAIENYWSEQDGNIGSIAMRETFAKPAQALALAGSVAPMAYDYLFNDANEAADWYHANVTDELGRDAVDYWTPNANDVDGAAELLGNVIGGVGQFATMGPAGFVATQELTAGIDYVRQGVDADTATALAVGRGAAAAVGAWLPIFGNTGLQKVVTAAAANPAIGVAERLAAREVLESEGMGQLAQNPWEIESIALDALMGAAFAGRSAMKGEVAPSIADAVFGRKLTEAGAAIKDRASLLKAKGELPGLHDALMTIANYNHRVYGSMPGRPSDPSVVHAHVNQLDAASDAIMRGESVPVRGGRLDFVSDKADIVEASLRKTIDDADADAILDEGIKPSPKRAKKLEPVEPIEETGNPDIDAVRAAIASGDFEIVTREIDPTTGRAELKETGRKASDVLAEMEAELKAADVEAKAIEAAASCYLTGA